MTKLFSSSSLFFIFVSENIIPKFSEFPQIKADAIIKNRDAYFSSNRDATAGNLDIYGIVFDANTRRDTNTQVEIDRSCRAACQLQLRVCASVCVASNSTCFGSANIKIEWSKLVIQRDVIMLNTPALLKTSNDGPKRFFVTLT